MDTSTHTLLLGESVAHKGVCDLKKLRNRIELPRTLHAHLCDSFVPTSERTLEKESREKKKAIEGLWAVESLAPASSRSAHMGMGVGIIILGLPRQSLTWLSGALAGCAPGTPCRCLPCSPQSCQPGASSGFRGTSERGAWPAR